MVEHEPEPPTNIGSDTTEKKAVTAGMAAGCLLPKAVPSVSAIMPAGARTVRGCEGTAHSCKQINHV